LLIARLPAPPVEHLDVTLPLTLFLLLQAADVATTHAILKRGGRELNPVGRFALGFGMPGVLVLKAAGTGLLLYAAYLEGAVMLWIGCAIMAAAVAFNLRSLR
jgi:hypothetical protein